MEDIFLPHVNYVKLTNKDVYINYNNAVSFYLIRIKLMSVYFIIVCAYKSHITYLILSQQQSTIKSSNQKNQILNHLPFLTFRQIL